MPIIEKLDHLSLILPLECINWDCNGVTRNVCILQPRLTRGSPLGAATNVAGNSEHSRVLTLSRECTCTATLTLDPHLEIPWFPSPSLRSPLKGLG